MRRVGLIGGLSAESTITYYQTLIADTRDRLGGWNSPSLLIASANFAAAEELRRAGDLAALADLIAGEAIRLQTAGAEIIAIGSNTMHVTYDLVEARISVPLLHIADSTSRALRERAFTSAGFLGTGHTRTLADYHSRLTQHGARIILPTLEDQELIDEIIYDELCVGILSPKSRMTLVEISTRMAKSGARAVIAGCTELSLLIKPKDMPHIPLMDTVQLHCRDLIEFSLGRDNQGLQAQHDHSHQYGLRAFPPDIYTTTRP